MGDVFRVVDQSVFHLVRAGAVIFRIGIGEPFLERRRSGYELKGRARLICVVDQRVSPELAEIGHLFLVRHGVVDFFDCRVYGVGGIVGIKRRGHGHGEHLCGVRIHRYGVYPVGLGLAQSVVHGVLQIVLEHLVYGQDHAEAVQGFICGVLPEPEQVAVDICISDGSSGHTGEILVVRELYSGSAYPVSVHASKEVRGKAPERIEPLGVLGDLYAGDIELAHLVGDVFFYIALKPQKGLVGVQGLCDDAAVHPEHHRQAVGRLGDLLTLFAVGLPDGRRPDPDGIAGHAGREDFAVPVVDRASLRGDGDIACLELHRPFLVLVAVHHLDPGSPEQKGEHQYRKHAKSEEDPPLPHETPLCFLLPSLPAIRHFRLVSTSF